MYDYSTFNKGSVYEILDANGTPLNKLYMVVSNIQFNAMGNNVFMVMIDTPVSNAKADLYHVPFDIICNGEKTPMHIYCEVFLSINKKRINKYKFTLSPEIQRQVDKKICQLLTGETMYSLNEAIVELHNIEMDKRVAAVTQNEITENISINEEIAEEVDYDDTDLDTEDAQKLFAMKMKNEPIAISVDPPKEKEPIKESPKETEVIKTPKKENKPKHKRGGHTTDSPGHIDPKYKHVYENKTDFLLDYYSMPKEEVAEKWGLDDPKSVSNRAYACRQMLIREGADMSYFDQLSKEHMKEMKSGKRRKSKIIKMPAV